MNLPRSQSYQLIRYLLQESALILVLSYLVLIAGNQAGLVSPSTMAITAGLLTVLATATLFLTRYSPLEIQLPVLVFLAALLLTSLTSIDPRRSLSETWLIALPFFLMFVVSALVQYGWPGELFIKTLLISGALVMGFAMTDAVRWYLGWLQAAPGQWIPTIAYRLPAPNFLAVMANILLMLALARLLETRALVVRILLGLYSLFAIVVLYLTSSRGGWLGTIGGLAALGLVTMMKDPGKWRAVLSRLARSRLVLAGLTVGLIAAAALFAWIMIRQSAQPTHGPLLSSRGYLWAPAWKAFLRSPLIGVGPFTYISLFLQANSVPPTEMFPYSHNLYLDILSSSGLLGFAAFAWLGVALVRGLFNRLNQATGLERSVIAGAAAALGAFAVHGMFDSVHHTLPIALWTMLIVLGAAFGTGSKRSSSAVQRLPLRLLGIGTAAAAWFFLYLALPLNNGVVLADAGSWDQAVPLLEEAARRDPTSAIAYQQLGLAESMLAKNGDQRALALSIAAFKRAVSIDPYWSLNHANLAVLYEAQGDLKAARSSWEEAVRRAPQATLFVLQLANVLEESGELEAARGMYQRGLEQSPAWAQSAFWEQTPLRQAVIDGWLEGHPPGIRSSISELEAQLSADPHRLSSYLPLVQAYLDAGRVEDAGRVLKQAPSATATLVTEWMELEWLRAEMAAGQGNYAAAVTLGQTVVDGSRTLVAYTPSYAEARGYGVWMFRQPAMARQVVPQLMPVEPAGLEERQRRVDGWKEKVEGKLSKRD